VFVGRRSYLCRRIAASFRLICTTELHRTVWGSRGGFVRRGASFIVAPEGSGCIALCSSTPCCCSLGQLWAASRLVASPSVVAQQVVRADARKLCAFTSRGLWRGSTPSLELRRVVAVVLLPGMDGSGWLFDEFVSELKCKTMVISYPTDRPLGYEELEHHVRSVLPSDEPLVLLAESFSGPLAIALAANPPPQLKALVLVCTFARLPVPSFALLWFKAIGLLPLWRAPTFLASRMLLGRFRAEAKEAVLRRAIEAVTPQTWRARLNAVLSADKTSSLCRIQLPLLYLRASEDRVVFSSASAVISAHVPGTKVVAMKAHISCCNQNHKSARPRSGRLLVSTASRSNKPLVPTRNGEAPLLAAQRRRYA
jgi:pimeloyl-[acyl-carrier protein] methyl ester esterase